jgi:hypothetical protein
VGQGQVCLRGMGGQRSPRQWGAGCAECFPLTSPNPSSSVLPVHNFCPPTWGVTGKGCEGLCFQVSALLLLGSGFPPSTWWTKEKTESQEHQALWLGPFSRSAHQPCVSGQERTMSGLMGRRALYNHLILVTVDPLSCHVGPARCC